MRRETVVIRNAFAPKFSQGFTREMATETALVLGQPIEFKDLSAEFARIKDARKSEGLIQTARASLLIILKPECMDRTVDEIEKMVARRERWHPDPVIKRLALKRKTLSTGMKDGGGQEAQVLQIDEFEVDTSNPYSDLSQNHPRVLPETYHVLEDLQISSHDASKMAISLKMPDGSLIYLVCKPSTCARIILEVAAKLLGGWSRDGFYITTPEGERLTDRPTLEELGVEWGDTLDVCTYQVGGMYHPTSGMDDLEPIASPHAPPAAVQGPKHSGVIVELLEEPPSGTGGAAKRERVRGGLVTVPGTTTVAEALAMMEGPRGDGGGGAGAGSKRSKLDASLLAAVDGLDEEGRKELLQLLGGRQ